MTQLNESDWRMFRKLRPAALERFCRRTLDAVAGIANDTGRSGHERYLAIYRLIQRRDRELASAFNDPRRSQALEQLAAIRSLGLLNEEEMSRFSPETRKTVDLILGANG